MSWHAVDAVDDAVEATRRFLFPFGLVRWAKLGFLVLLMGGGVSTNVSLPFGPQAEFTTFPDGAPEAPPALSGDPLAGVDTALILAAVAAVALVAIAFGIASVSLRLAYYDALRTNAVRVWRPFVRRLGQAAGLFVFTAVVGAVLLAPVAVAVLVGAGVGWGPIAALEGFAAGVSAAGLAAFGLLAVLVGIVVLLALRITNEFVVPVMVLRDDGVLAAWRRVWTRLRGSPREFLVYLLVHLVLSVGLSVARSVALFVAGGAVAVVAAIALVIAAAVLGGLGALVETTAGAVVLVAVIVLALAAVILAFVPVLILTRTYLVAYEVSTLGGIDPDLALLAPAIDPAADADSA